MRARRGARRQGLASRSRLLPHLRASLAAERAPRPFLLASCALLRRSFRVGAHTRHSRSADMCSLFAQRPPLRWSCCKRSSAAAPSSPSAPTWMGCLAAASHPAKSQSAAQACTLCLTDSCVDAACSVSTQDLCVHDYWLRAVLLRRTFASSVRADVSVHACPVHRWRPRPWQDAAEARLRRCAPLVCGRQTCKCRCADALCNTQQHPAVHHRAAPARVWRPRRRGHLHRRVMRCSNLRGI